jgi:hypothetical protein
MTVAGSIHANLRPFPHVVSPAYLPADLAEATLGWLEADAPWKLHVEDFYEQHECALEPDQLPPAVAPVASRQAVRDYARSLLEPIGSGPLELAQATAHRLSGGQSIRIHNDYIEGAETHRVLIQLNRGWSDENGGFLMLFSSPDASDVARVIRPIHRSATAFEISPNSFHAVSPTTAGERYTLVFSYRRVT